MVWLVTEETRIVFEAGRPLGDLRPTAPFEQVSLRARRRTRASALVAAAGRATDAATERPWVLFLHGNASNIASRLNILHCETPARARR